MVRAEGITVARGIRAVEAFDFVLDPAQYTKADTKMVWVTKLADIPNGMLAREDGKFLGRFKGSVFTRYHWNRPNYIDEPLSTVLQEAFTHGSKLKMSWTVFGFDTSRNLSSGMVSLARSMT